MADDRSLVIYPHTNNIGVGVYFLSGPDEAGKQAFIDKIKSKLFPAGQSLDYNSYYSDEAVISDVIQLLKTAPFSAKSRLVVLKDAEKLKEEDKQALALYLENPSVKSIFVITTKKDLNASDALAASAKKHAKCLDFSLNTGSSLPQDAAFKLIDEISLKKQKQALKSLIMLMRDGKEPYEILGLIGWHLRRMGKVKLLIERGKGKEEIARDLQWSFNRVQKAMEQSRNFTFRELKAAQRLLTETDRNLKRSAAPPGVLLESLIMRLSA